MLEHVIIDMGQRFQGDEPRRRCCMCELPEALCPKYPDCKGKVGVPYTQADAKTAKRYKRRRRERRIG